MTQELDALRAERDFYQSLFDNAPIALMEENFAAVKISLDKLRSSGVQDLHAYFESQPGAMRQHYELINKEVTINKEFVALCKADSLEQLESQLDDTVLTEHSLQALQKCFVALASGATRFSTTTRDNAVDGSTVDAFVTWAIVPTYENTWERIIVSVIPLQLMTEVLASTKG